MRLGPVARKVINPDAWTGGYPGPQAYVRELDALLHFANQNGYLGRFVPNLEARDRQRDKALNELHRPDESSVFVEIKSPGWERGTELLWRGRLFHIHSL